MSDWDRFRKPGPKRPPPAHGIKVKKPGTTWWGARWIAALEGMSSAYGLRLARGKTYARAGRAHDLLIDRGRVTAQVTGSRAEPYEVTIALSELSDETWRAAIASMAARAQFAAELLAGSMPEPIDEAFGAGSASLFPIQERDLVTACSCPDWANPCKHVAATHYVLAEALDRDPFLLFELRGRSKERVLAALRVARSGEDGRARELDAIPTQTLDVSEDDYDKPRAELPSLSFSFEPPPLTAAAIATLGEPAAWSGERSVADWLAPSVRAAAERARQIALADNEPTSAPPPKKKR